MKELTTHRDMVLQCVQALMAAGPVPSLVNETATYLYNPHPRLRTYLTELELFANGSKSLPKKEYGELLEQVAALCFAGLEGAPSPLSVRVAEAQLDVLQLASSDIRWLTLAWLLGFRAGQTSILIECKCYVPDPDKLSKGVVDGESVGQIHYARLAGLMQTSLLNSVGLGVMVSLWGGSQGNYKTALAESKLFRVKHLARYGTPIIDLTLDDIRSHCLVRGGLPRLLINKVQELAALSGLEILTVEGAKEDILPDHIKNALGVPTPPP